MRAVDSTAAKQEVLMKATPRMILAAIREGGYEQHFGVDSELGKPEGFYILTWSNPGKVKACAYGVAALNLIADGTFPSSLYSPESLARFLGNFDNYLERQRDFNFNSHSDTEGIIKLNDEQQLNFAEIANAVTAALPVEMLDKPLIELPHIYV